MRIEFTHHFTKRKTERNDYLIPTCHYRDTRVSKQKVESTMRRKGKWFYRYSQKEGIIRTYCIVNKLEVYCGILIDEDDDLIVLITTYFPYSSKIKKKLFPRGRENFETFDIESTGEITFPDRLHLPI